MKDKIKKLEECIKNLKEKAKIIDEILAGGKKELSLSELANEKGFQVVHIVKFGEDNHSITIGKFMEKDGEKEFRANTSFEAEDKLRKYLLTLKK